MVPAASSVVRIAARLLSDGVTLPEVGDDVARNDGPARQVGLIHVDKRAGGAALRRQDRQTQSPSYTALQRSWTLTECAFSHSASAKSKSVNFASP